MASQATAVQGSATYAVQPILSAQVNRSSPTYGLVVSSPCNFNSRDEFRKLSSSFACSSYSCESILGNGQVQPGLMQTRRRKANMKVRSAAAPVGLGPEDDGDENDGADFGQVRLLKQICIVGIHVSEMLFVQQVSNASVRLRHSVFLQST